MARSARKDTDDATPRNLGRYRLYGELAAGGMSTVHLGRQIGSGGFSKMVAIKRLHPQYARVPEFVDAFLAEARLAARIRHPNVVQPLDVLRVDDEVFLVMEYVEGESLSRLMRATVSRQEKVPLPIAIAILSGVLRGLHAAHEAKNDRGEPLEMVHRDISPQNILVGVDGTPRVIDFGIAKAANSIQITREGELKGKLAYISPEVLNGHRVTRRSDIYATSVVLWEVLTAQRLFDDESQSAIMANILQRPVERPSEFVDGIPPELDRVVLRGLAREPSDRYVTAREMAVALEDATAAASPALVGEWVETLAAPSLANRGRRVAQIEAHSSEEEVDEAEEVLSEFILGSTSTREPTIPSGLAMRGPGQSDGRISAVPPPSSASRRPASSQDGRISAIPPSSASSSVQRSRSPTLKSREALEAFGSPTARTVQASDAEQIVPAWPVPGIAPAAPGSVVQLGPKHRSSGGGIVALILVVALTLALLYVGLPEFLKRAITAGAANEGVTLSIDAVEVSFLRIRIVGITATMADLPGVNAHAQSVEVWFSYRLDPTDAAVHDARVSIDGSETVMQDSFRRMQMAHDFVALRDSPLRHVAFDAGHLIWARALGEGTRVEAENITLDAERSGHDALGEEVSFASPIVVVEAPWGKVGPWIASGQADHGLVKATLQLDPSGASKAAATFVIDKGHVSTFDLTLPRSNVEQLGVGNALLGRRPDEALFVEGEAHYALRSASRFEAGLRLGLSGARLANAIGGTDAQLEGYVDGEPAHPTPLIKGAFAFGPFRGTLSGPVTIGDTFVRAELALRTGAAHCPPGTDVSLGGGIAFDTRALGDARISVVPSGRCSLKILPPGP